MPDSLILQGDARHIHHQRLPKFSGYSSGWKTPADVWAALHEEFNFDFDPCPTNPPHALFDGLTHEWGKRSFVNPPYGHKHIERWMKKGLDESRSGKLVVFLVPSRTDTRWWHEYALRATEIRFIRRRLAFNGRGSAPFPSCVIVFDGREQAHLPLGG